MKPYEHICQKRKNHHHNNDIWWLRFHWQREKAALQKELRTGNYRFEPAKLVPLKGHSIQVWSARDAVVIKAIAQVLKCVRRMYRVLEALHVKIAQAKTYIGKIPKGFDFLGLRFGAYNSNPITLIKMMNRKTKKRVDKP